MQCTRGGGGTSHAVGRLRLSNLPDAWLATGSLAVAAVAGRLAGRRAG